MKSRRRRGESSEDEAAFDHGSGKQVLYVYVCMYIYYSNNDNNDNY